MLSAEEVKHIALLARIGLSDEEVALYQKDLSGVLDFFRELEKLPTDDVVPIGHITGTVGTIGNARSDAAEHFDAHGKDGIKKNMPVTKDGYLKVKSVF